MSCPSLLGPTINLSRLVWPPTTSPGVGQRPCVWLRSGVRAERAGGPPRAERPRAAGGRRQAWESPEDTVVGTQQGTRGHGGDLKARRSATGTGDAAAEGRCCWLTQRGGWAGAPGHSCSFPDQVTCPKPGGPREHPQGGHPPRDRRSPPGPGAASTPHTVHSGRPKGPQPAEELGLPGASQP